jgi:hypothetical protein
MNEHRIGVSEVPKVLSLRRPARNTPISLREKPLRVRSLRDAKKLLARILVAFQRGEMGGRDAKDLAYLLSVWVQIAKDVELEERLVMLENHFGRKTM